MGKAFISSNDSILFFSSQGHSSIGGMDVFYSELESDGKWTEPRNLGYPVNTTADNLFFNPGWGEMDGYYRYASGRFHSFEEARTYLEKMKKAGYEDAFIQTLDWYSKAVN